MKAPAIIEVDGKKYMSTATAAEYWGLKPRTVSGYCHNGRVIDKIKNSGWGWYISIDEVKPLSKNELKRLLFLSLHLKNNPNLEIDWSTFDFDISNVEVIYKNLVKQKYIEDFEIENVKEIPYKVVLTEKGFDLLQSSDKEITTDISTVIKKATNSDVLKLLQQSTTIICNLINIYCLSKGIR